MPTRSELEQLRRELAELRAAQEELRARQGASAKAIQQISPKIPVRPPTVYPIGPPERERAAPATEMAQLRREVQELRGRAGIVGAPPIEVKPSEEPRRWFLDPEEERKVIQEAARIAKEERPETVVRRRAPGLAARPPAMRPTPPLPERERAVAAIERAEGRAGPLARRRLAAPPEGGFMARYPEMVAEAVRRGEYIPGMRPPEVAPAIRQRPRPFTPEYFGEAARALQEVLRSRVQPPAPEGVTGEYYTIEEKPEPGAPIGMYGELLGGVKLHPTQWWRRVKAGGPLGLGRYALGVPEALADIFVRGLNQLAYGAERVLGQFTLRNMADPETAEENWDRSEIEYYMAGVPGGEEISGRLKQEAMTQHKELYSRINNPELDLGDRDKVIDYLSRIAYSGAPAQTRAFDRIMADEDPEKVLAEEEDIVREMTGQIINDPLNLIGMAAGYFKGRYVLAKYRKFWGNPILGDPDAFKLIGKTKAVTEALNPFAWTRSSLAVKAHDAVGYITSALARGWGDNPDEIIRTLKAIQSDEGLGILARAQGVDAQSEGFKVVRRVLEEIDLDEFDSLKNVLGPRQYEMLPPEAPEAIKLFNPMDFLDEMEQVSREITRRLWMAELDVPAKWNVLARLNQAWKGHISDVYLGMNPGYMWRNFYNNTITLGVDDLLSLDAIRPGARKAWLDAWFEDLVPSAYDIGWSGRAEVGIRPTGEVVETMASRNPLRMIADKGHAVAAKIENLGWDIGRTTGLRRCHKWLWWGDGEESFGRAARALFDEYAPGVAPWVKEHILDLSKQSVNDNQLVKWVDDFYNKFRWGPIGGGEWAPKPVPVGEVWEGPAFRGGESAIPRGVSAADVVRYEVEELGNDIAFDMARIGELEDVPGNRLVWVTKTEEDAARYGEILHVDIPPGSKIVAGDQEGGYLVLKAERAGAAVEESALSRLAGEMDQANALRETDEAARELALKELGPQFEAEGGWKQHLIEQGEDVSKPWKLSRQDYEGPSYLMLAGDDSAANYFRRGREWEQSMLAAVSEGKITPADAKAKDYMRIPEFRDLPQDEILYHVTTAKRAVQREGLKTRFELGMVGGRGLGGGEETAISFTRDPATALNIEFHLDEGRRVARGEIDIDELYRMAEAGDRAERPFLTDLGWQEGGANRFQYQDIKEGTYHGVQFGPDWTEAEKAADLRKRTWDAYQSFLWMREEAGGPANPVFFTTDFEALAKVDPQDIAVLSFKAKPGARGRQMAALGEWRVYSGAAVSPLEKDIPEAASEAVVKEYERLFMRPGGPNRYSPSVVRYVPEDVNPSMGLVENMQATVDDMADRPALDDLARQAREAEDAGQAQMFAEGQDLPLFTETAPRAEVEPFRPPEEAGRQLRMPGADCPVCLGTGSFGGKRCVCGGAGSREAAQRGLDNAVVGEFMRQMQDLEADVKMQVAVEEALDLRGIDPETGARMPVLITGNVQAAEMPKPLHWFPGEARRIEKALEEVKGLKFRDWVDRYLKAAAEATGLPEEAIEFPYGVGARTPGGPWEWHIRPFTWKETYEKEHWAYLRSILKEAEEAGIPLGAEHKAFLAQDEFIPTFKLPGSVELRKLTQETAERKAREFIEFANKRGITEISSNKELGGWLRLTEEEATELADFLAAHGNVEPAWTAGGYRRVLSTEKVGELDEFKQLQGMLDQLDAKRARRGGMIDDYSEKLEQRIIERMNALTGESFDMPVSDSMVSPMEVAVVEDMAERQMDVRRMQQWTEEEQLAEMTVEEVREWADEAAGKWTDAEEWARYLEDPATRDQLFDFWYSRRHYNGRERAVTLRTARNVAKEPIQYGNKPSQRLLDIWREQGRDAEWIASKMPKEHPYTPPDKMLQEYEELYPAFYRQLRDKLSRQQGAEVGDEDLIREVIRMRMRLEVDYIAPARREVQIQAEELDRLSAELARREAAAVEEEMRRFGPPLWGEAEELAAPPMEATEFQRLAAKARRGELGIEELEDAVRSGEITQDEADLLRGVRPGEPEAIRGEQRAAAEARQQELLKEEIARREAAQGSTDTGPLRSEMRRAQSGDDVRTIQAVKRRLLGEGGGRPPSVPPGVQITPDDYKNIRRWMKEGVAPNRAAMRLVSEGYTKSIVGTALLDYRMRRNFDLWTAMVCPYPYWYTHNAVNWGERIARKPWMFTASRRAQRAIRDQNEELPSRLKDSIGIHFDKLPGDWTGDTIYVNPIRNLMPAANMYPWDDLFVNYDWDDPLEAREGLGILSGFFEEFGFRMYPWIETPIKAITGEEAYYAAPQTPFIRGVSALAREAGIGEEVIPPGGWNIERPLWEALGIPVDVSQELYWPMQGLSMMVAEGEAEYQDAEDAMLHVALGDIEQYPELNELYQRSRQRAGVMRGLAAFTSFAFGQSVAIQPEGEIVLRKLQRGLSELGLTWERPAGTAEERFEYYDEHPVLNLRQDTFAFFGKKLWMFRNPDGTYDIEAWKKDQERFKELGGGSAEVERRIMMRRFGRELEDVREKKAQSDNKLMGQGIVPGTRGWRLYDQWWWENIEGPFYAQYEKYFTQERAAGPPFRASPREILAWREEQDVREIGREYYAIKPEDFAGDDGFIDWDGFYGERERIKQLLPPEMRLPFEQYLHRNWTPEQEVIKAVEDQVYGAMRELISRIAESEDDDERKALQEELNELKAAAPDAVDDALAERVSDIMELHPEWGDEELERLWAFDVPGFETWRRSFQTTRTAMEGAFKEIYWGLDSGTRKTLRDQKWAEKAKTPGNYLGQEFEKWEGENHRLEGLSDVPDTQLLQWLQQMGLSQLLAKEGIPIPGEPIPEELREIPGYEERAAGMEPEIPIEAAGRAGAELRQREPGLAGLIQPPGVAERRGFLEEAERGPYYGLRERAREARPEAAPEAARPVGEAAPELQEELAQIAVGNEPTEEPDVGVVSPVFEMPDEEIRAEMAQAFADMDAWVAGGEAGDWTPMMEKWFGDPDSPKSQYWKLRRDMMAAPEENNPMGWSLMPAILKDSPFTKLINQAYSDGTQDELEPELFEQARQEMQEFLDEHGEEFLQAREEYIGYLALLQPEMEELQDQYYSYPTGSDERRQLYPQLEAYWAMKREYKDQHPLMVKFYFPEYQAGQGYTAGPRVIFARGGRWRRGGGGGGRAPAPWIMPMRQVPIIIPQAPGGGQRRYGAPMPPTRIRYLRS